MQPNASTLAPIALFCFKRTDHLRRTIESLQGNPEYAASTIYVFGDGPKTLDDAPLVKETRQIAQDLLGSHGHYRFSNVNLGLARSIIHGVSELTERYGHVIVVEDDLQVDAQFLSFMNHAIHRYRDESAVMQVSGYMFNSREFDKRASPVFLPFPSSWGWATWRRAWRQFDPAATGWELLGRDKALRRQFNLNGAYDYATMLTRQMKGVGDSWAIRWYWSVFRSQGLVVYPPQTLVRNTGFDGSGTHGGGLFRRFRDQRPQPVARSYDLSADPKLVLEDLTVVRQTIWRQNGGYLGKFVDLVRRI
jgi:hypothetical protein